jgi:DNA-binding NtrC family response regulator
MDQFRSIKATLAALIGVSIIYGVVALAYVATTPDLRIRCVLSSDVASLKDGQRVTGLRIQSESLDDGVAGYSPASGDLLISLAGQRVESFQDLSQATVALRDPKLVPGASLEAGTNPSNDLDPESTFSLVFVEGQPGETGYYFARAWFVRPETGQVLNGWLPLQPQPLGLLSVSLIWLVLQIGVILVAGIAFWHRPYDRPLRLFLCLSVAALVAFIGGSHWWVIFGQFWFLAPFAIAALLLPAVLLHFVLVFPTPKPFYLHRPRLVNAAIYSLPTLAAGAGVAAAAGGFWLARDFGANPLAEMYEQLGSQAYARLLPWVQSGISWYLSLAAGYFVLTLSALIHSYYRSQRRYEHEQVRWILLAGIAATFPLGYSLVMAYADPADFAFGASQLPLFLAAVLFTAAYAVGIVRYRLMLIDQVLNRGVVYYLVSAGLTVLFGMAVAFGTTAAVHQDIGTFGHPILVFLVLIVASVILLWLRDRLQRGIDREFFREKYPLDRALKRMNQAVSGLLDRQTLADRMLLSCREVLQTDRGAIYLRNPQSREFQLVTSSGPDAFATQFEGPREFIETLSSGLSLQRVRSGSSPIQQLMRTLDAELIHGLDVDGTLSGLVVLGPKPGANGYNAEDVAFLTALGRLAGVTLHFGKLHEDITRMQGDFSQLNDELARRMEDVGRLKSDLDAKDSALDRQRRRIESLEQQLSMRQSPGVRKDEPQFEVPTILGTSLAIRSVLDTVRKTAPTNSSVLIRGESGTGKELLARAIHENSPRKGGPLVSVHCAALAQGVLESELFGHVKGAFTDARQDRAGRFQTASGGTLFLDEIGDVPLETQVKLLRVLQERMIEPVGGAKPIPVDVRLIAATHRNLEQFIAEGKFREDLYYRLNVISIRLPSLRERGDDIVELAVQFLHRAAERTGKSVSHFDDDVLERFLQYSWPGNVRELEDVVERSVVMSEGDRIILDDLPADIRQSAAITPPRRSSPLVATAARSTAANSDSDEYLDRPGMSTTIIADVTNGTIIGSEEERQVLKEALARCDGNKARAARLLGMPRSTYFSKLRKHGLD